jgi:hypothetical protein
MRIRRLSVQVVPATLTAFGQSSKRRSLKMEQVAGSD